MFDLLSSVISPIVGKFVNLIPDPNARAKAQEEFEKELLVAIMQSSKDQAEINKIEAGNSSVFVAGWRPFIGWVCGVAILWSFLLQPILVWVLTVIGHSGQSLPNINSDGLFQLVLAMLGMGGLRTFEKIKGVAK